MGVQPFRAGGRTDRHDEASSRFSQFYESTLKKICFPRHYQTHTANSGVLNLALLPNFVITL